MQEIFQFTDLQARLAALADVTATHQVRHDRVQLAQFGVLVLDGWAGSLVQRDLHEDGDDVESQEVLTLQHASRTRFVNTRHT